LEKYPLDRQPASFAELLTAVNGVVRTRVRNGYATERGLALLVGVSQPHLHNVLKGARQMTPALADRLIKALEIDLGELLQFAQACDKASR